MGWKRKQEEADRKRLEMEAHDDHENVEKKKGRLRKLKEDQGKEEADAKNGLKLKLMEC